MSKTDINELEKEIEDIFTRRGYQNYPLYKMLKRVLTKLGNWKAKPRGNPAKGWLKYQESKEQKQHQADG